MQFFKQLQRKRNAGYIDAEVPLQPSRNSRVVKMKLGKAPLVTRAADGFKHGFHDPFNHLLCGHCMGKAEFNQRHAEAFTACVGERAGLGFTTGHVSAGHVTMGL